MSLSATLNTAQSALATNAALSTVVSRNIAGVNDPNYSRKTGNVLTDGLGNATVASITRATNTALFAALLSANATSAANTALSTGLDQIEQTVTLTNTATSTSASTTDNSPATAVGALATALQSYAADPGNTASGQAVVTAAKSLASNLNTATTAVQSIRTQADASIGSAVSTINTLLSQYQTLNDAVVKGTATGADITDTLDQRGAVLQSLSQQIGITTVNAPNGSLSIYTDSGATLFQTTARTVAFAPTTSYAAGTTGNAVTVDGVAITGPSATMPVKGGAIAGLTQLRDVTTVKYQNQLDQIAQGLISSFGESDQTGGAAPTIPGLFTAPGASATATTTTAGLAGAIVVNANVDPTQGGTLTRLRDGGIGNPNDAAYDANTSGAASYAGHLRALSASLAASRSFDASTGGTASGSVANYANSSVDWLESERQTATSASTNSSAVVSATTTSLSNATGVNLDTELSKMLDLEHSYSASAELMSTVKNMFDTLLAAFRQ